MRKFKYYGWRWLALAAAGSTFFMSGCDPTLRTTVENGIITLSQSLLGSFLRVFIDLLGEKNDQTARLMSDIGAWFA